MKGLLESNGIEAAVGGEALFAVRGAVPLTTETLPGVWVLQEGWVARAREIIAEYKRGREPSGDGTSPWRCASCGEPKESQFTNCWQCGADRPGLPPATG